MARLISSNLGRLPANLDGVVGIPRSGMLAADMIALHLSLPVMTLADVCERRPIAVGQRMHMDEQLRKEFLLRPRRLLVVDDSCGTGGTMKTVQRMLSELPIKHNCKRMVAYANKQGMKWVDIWLEQLEKPRFFEWNWMSNIILRESCIDIDGVLCRDPRQEENDEATGGAQRYHHFLTSVPRLRKLRQPLGTLVTCRLEKWRDVTEAWLTTHGIQYQKLVMMQFKTVRERKAFGHAKYKAQEYKRAKAKLFVESGLKQAMNIHKLTRKPVLCTETMDLFK